MRRTHAGMLIGALSLVVTSLGPAPATPSFYPIEDTIRDVRARWEKVGAQNVRNSSGWNAFFDALDRDLKAYGSARSEDDRLRALERIYRHSTALRAVSWGPAAELREELRDWLRPRVTLAWTVRRLSQAVRGLPPAPDDEARENRDRWIRFAKDDLGQAIGVYESAAQVRDRREGLRRIESALNDLQARNSVTPWAPGLALQGAVDGLFGRPNLSATADERIVQPRLANFVVTSGPVYRNGQVSQVTAGPFLGFGLMPSDDGIAFYNQQMANSVTPIQGFHQQVAQDPKGRRAAKLYQFAATSQDTSIVTVTALLRPSGLQLFPSSSHNISAAVTSVPTQGRKLGRFIAGLVGFSQPKITQQVYEGAIGKIQQGVIEGSQQEAAERTAQAQAEKNAQLAANLVGGNTLLVRNLAITDLVMRSRPGFAMIVGTLRWANGTLQHGADFPEPRELQSFQEGVAADVHLPSMATNLSRGYLGRPGVQFARNVMIVTRPIPPGAPPREGIQATPNADFETFSKAVDEAHAANDPKRTAILMRVPKQAPEFFASRNGELVVLVPDFSVDVPAPPAAEKGGLAGPPARIYRLESKLAEFVLSWEFDPATGRLSAKVVNFDAGPGARVLAINEDEAQAVALNAFTSAIILRVFAGRLGGLPIDVPVQNVNLPGYTIADVSRLDPTGWMRVVLVPAGSQPPAATQPVQARVTGAPAPSVRQ